VRIVWYDTDNSSAMSFGLAPRGDAHRDLGFPLGEAVEPAQQRGGGVRLILWIYDDD
jgi:hypothetical protein